MLTADPSFSEMIMIPLCYSPPLHIPLHFPGIPKKAFDALNLFINRIQLLQKTISLFMHITEHEGTAKESALHIVAEWAHG